MAVIETEIAAHRWVAIDPESTLAGLGPVAWQDRAIPDSSLSGQIGQTWPAWSPEALLEAGPSVPIRRESVVATPSENPDSFEAPLAHAKAQDEPEAPSRRAPRRVPEQDIVGIGWTGTPSEADTVLAARSALPRLGRSFPKRLSGAGMTTVQRLLCLILATAIVGGAIYVTAQAMRPHVIYVPATVSDRSAIV